MLKIALCDDEKIFIDILAQKINEFFLKSGIETFIEKFKTGDELLNAIEKKKKVFDIIFLDINMPKYNGFTIASRIRQKDFQNETIIIFITNEDKFIKHGYKFNAFRYIVKSELDNDLVEALNCIIKKYEMINSDKNKIELKYKNDTMIDTLKVDVNDIIYLYKNRKLFSKNTKIELTYGGFILVGLPLIEYKKIINKEYFVIVKRSYLINLFHVKSIIGDIVTMSDNLSLPIGSSNKKKEEFLYKYGKFKKSLI